MEVVEEEGGQYYTVIMGKDSRPASPEPASSPCPSLHTVTGLGLKEGWQNRSREPVVVQSVHHCTLLNASVITSNIVEVKRILESGQVTIDSLTDYDCSGSPVLCEAAYHGSYECMKLLLEYRAFVDITNHLGLSPAHIAAGQSMDQPKMLSLLVQYKADINKRSKNGSSPLHIAAEKGNIRIVKMLLESNQLKEEIITESYRNGTICLPPPIVLAAANHHKHVVKAMMKYTPLYPSHLTSNINLIYWAYATIAKYFYQQGVLSSLNESLAELDEALAGRDLTSEFGVKIYTGQDLELQQGTNPLTIIHQSLTLLECIIGPNSKLHINEMERVLKTLCKRSGVKFCKEIEEILLKTLKIMPQTELELIAMETYMMPSHLHVFLSMFMSKTFWETLGTLTVNHHPVNYVPLLENFMIIVDTILHLKSRQSCQKLDHWGESFQNTFCQLLSLFACSLHASNQPNSPTDKKKLHQIGMSLINKYTDHMTTYFTSFLHFTLRKVKHIVDLLKLSMIGGRNAINSYIRLIEMLLFLGCSDVAVINTPYKQFFCQGELPLHMAVRLAEMDPCYLPIVNLMFIHGAHYDGISVTGVTPQDIATRPPLRACFDLQPLPLACLVSKVIVSNKIEYWDSLYLPRVVKRFISYHDTDVKLV